MVEESLKGEGSEERWGVKGEKRSEGRGALRKDSWGQKERAVRGKSGNPNGEGSEWRGVSPNIYLPGIICNPIFDLI